MTILLLQRERSLHTLGALRGAHRQRDGQRHQNRQHHSQHHTLLASRSRREPRTGRSRRGSFTSLSSSRRTGSLPESSSASINESCTSGELCVATALTSSPCRAPWE